MIFTRVFLCAAALLGVAQGNPPSGTALLSAPPFDETWLPSNSSDQSITDEGLLEFDTPGVAYASQRLRLTNTSILAEVDFEEAEAVFLGVRVQPTGPISGYLLDLADNGAVQLVKLDGGGDTVLATGSAGVSQFKEPVRLCCELRGQRLRGWVWLASDAQPEMPTVETLLPQPLTFTDGEPVIGARNGKAVFSLAEIGGDAFRPTFLGLLPLSKEPRFKLSWESEVDEVYRIDVTPDRVVWETLYLHKATETASTAVIPPPATQGAFFRIVSVSEQVQIAAGIELIVPTSPRFAVAWESSEDRVYGFEWSQDLINWESFGNLAVPGSNGETISTTVLPLPEPLKAKDAPELYFRIVDLADETTFGLTQAAGSD